MLNHFKIRNFDHHHDNFSYLDVDDASPAIAFSNSVYDVSKGITHSFVHIQLDEDTSVTRLVSDVELAFSTDPSIVSICPPMVQSALRQGILNQPRGPVVPATDDELLNSVPDTFPRETSDIVKLSDLLNSEFSSKVSTSAPSTGSTSAPVTRPEVGPVTGPEVGPTAGPTSDSAF